jgi:hypothetical protein
MFPYILSHSTPPCAFFRLRGAMGLGNSSAVDARDLRSGDVVLFRRGVRLNSSVLHPAVLRGIVASQHGNSFSTREQRLPRM